MTAKYSLISVTIPKDCGYQLVLQITQEQLSGISFAPVDKNISGLSEPSKVTNALYLKQQFESYFENPYLDWDVPLLWPAATPYQRKVCDFLQTIKPATTISYGEMATQLNSGPRAVGNACRRNPFPIIIPCHRVVAKTGIGGYSGDSDQNQANKLNIKRYLLEHEQSFNQ